MPEPPPMNSSLPRPVGEAYGRGAEPFVPPPPTADGQFAPPPNQGPITGYGPGGMGLPPGSPPNPPYTHGGPVLPPGSPPNPPYTYGGPVQ